MDNKRNLLTAGAGLVWRYQRVWWWLFVLNLGIMLVAALPISRALGPLDYSLLSDRLVQGMDLGVLAAVLIKADVGFAFGTAARGLAPQLIYFALVLFLTGGILTAYAADRRLATGEFFQACGVYFWRLFRLMLLMALMLIPVGLIYSGWSALADGLGKGASEIANFWLAIAGLALLLVLLAIVRLWFDMAQVRTIIEDQPAVRKTLGPALRQTFGSFGRLFPLFIFPVLLGWVVFFLGFWVWQRIPSHRFVLSFLVWQVVLLCWIGLRLWQRAAEITWYQRHRVVEPAPSVFAAMPVPMAPEPTPDPAGAAPGAE